MVTVMRGGMVLWLYITKERVGEIKIVEFFNVFIWGGGGETKSSPISLHYSIR